MNGGRWGVDGLFDLRESPAFALATLGFGIAAFVAGACGSTCRTAIGWAAMRRRRSGCIMLAAPALVNTVALTLYNVGGGAGIASLSVALALIAVLALVIDRRSFLTAAIGYIAILIAWIVRGEDGDFASWTFVLILWAH